MDFTVVSTDWLNAEINKGNSDNLAVLDATWFSNKMTARDEFSRKHISCASFIDVFWGVQNTPVFVRNIPDSTTFQTNATECGVNTNDHVIIYENTGKFGFFLGARAWWMFKLFGHEKVSVLNGGLERWITDGYETTDIIAKNKKGSFTASYNPRWIKSYDDMVENLSSHKAQVCDSRSPELFNGSQDDPKSGHYPGAVNIPFSSLFDNNTRTLKTVEELKKVYSDTGIDLNKPVIGMCTGGMSSCSLVLTALMCGCPDTALFLGGFNEWKTKADSSRIAKS